MVIEKKIRTEFIIAALISTSLALLLFYLDEGKHNFEGLFRTDNLFLLGVYGAVFFGIQIGIQLAGQSVLTNKKINGLSNGIISALIMIVILASFFSLVA